MVDKTSIRAAKLGWAIAFCFVLCGFGIGMASSVTLVQFLAALEARPELAAASAEVDAAEASLAQAQNPVALDVSVSSRAPAAELTPFNDTRVGVGVTARPFLYGEAGDTVRLRELDLERARLNQREVRAQLEASAFESASALRFSERSLNLARSSVAAAAASFRAAQLRFDRGLATPAELRDAGTGRQRARNLVLNAEAEVQLARTTLVGLVGAARLKSLPKLTVPRRTLTPPAVRRAELELAAAQVVQAGAARPFYPVAELAYDYDVSAQNRLSASISSSDLAPRVGYSFDYDGYGEAPQLSLRVSATLAPEQFENATRLGALAQAAEASLTAAQQSAKIGEAQLRTRLAAARRDEKLAALVFSNVQQNLSEVRQREELGAGTPLETQAVAVAVAETGAELQSARRVATAALLDLYRFFGLPLSLSPTTPDLENP